MPTQILIADDNPAVRTALRQLLESAQFGEVIEAENGRDAIDKAQERKPDIVILDLVMPVMDGLVAARELSRIMPGVPLLMHTLHWSPQVEIEAQKVGVRKVIAKADSKGLISAIQEMLTSDSPAATTGGPETAVPANLLPAETAVLPPASESAQVAMAENSEAPAVAPSEDIAGKGPAN
jgi:DNA-binding NarL/FixJ family response regulator